MGVLRPSLRVPEGLNSGSTGSIIRKKGSKKLYFSFPYHEVRVVKSTRLNDTPQNQVKAREWLDRQMEKIAKGTFIFAKAFPDASEKEKAFHAAREGWEYKPEPHNVLFGDYVGIWLNKMMANCPSDNTKRDYRQIIGDRLLPELGGKTFYQINGVLLKDFLSTLKWRTGKNKGRRLSEARIRNIISPLRVIWSEACEENRWDLRDPFKFLAKHIPKDRKKHPVVLRFDEWLKIIENMRPYYRAIAELMIMTGMIGSEIAGLRRQDIVDGHMLVQNSIVRGHEKDDLKTTFRNRKIVITDAIRRPLEVAAARSESEYIFSMKSGRQFDVDSFRKNVWTPALKKAGMEYKVPYTTRHTFCAWSLAVGMDPNRLVSLMGHGSKKMVYEVYGNYVEGLEKDADKILTYFGTDFIGKKEAAPAALGKVLGKVWFSPMLTH
jgi:integrase